MCGVGWRWQKGAIMRKTLVLLAVLTAVPVTGASATDMPLKAPAVPYAAYNWTGFYLGGEFGGGWATDTATNLTTTTTFPAGFVHTPIRYSGILGGVYGGYNFQINQFVIGIDGDYTWAGLTGALTEPSALVAGAVVNTSDKINWISTVTGRAGYAINNWLLFVKGGWAWAGFSETGRGITPAGVVDSATSASSTRNGWTVGPGVEWGFAQHWSAKLEYDYVDFNRANFNLTATNLITGVVTVSSKSATSSLSMLKAGIDYRF